MPFHAGEVFLGIGAGVHLYQLRSMVCYYGEHYQALILLPATQRWVLFDDAHVNPVGTWADVRRKCQAGRIQPSMLFFVKVQTDDTKVVAEREDS